MEEYIEIGQIVNTYGIKGYLKIVAFTDNLERFDDLKSIFIDVKGTLEEKKIADVKYHKNLVLILLDNVYNINDVEKYKGYYIKINKKDRVKLPEDSYFISDLIGVEVWTDEECLGNLEDIFSTKSNDVYVVKNKDGKQILLPAISEVIKKVDLENRKITVNLLEGLI